MPTGGSGYFFYPGNELVWRATLDRSVHRDETSCSQLEIDWLFDAPVIESVVDIPGDQRFDEASFFHRVGVVDKKCRNQHERQRDSN